MIVKALRILFDWGSINFNITVRYINIVVLFVTHEKNDERNFT